MSFTCPRCERTSNHPKDEEHGYCSACHDWTGDDNQGEAVSSRRRNIDFNQPSQLGQLDLGKGLFVLKAHHGFVEPKHLFEEQDEPVFAIQFEGYDREGQDATCQVLLRPGVAGQLVSAIIAIATVKGIIEEVTEVVADELRQTTKGLVSLNIKSYNVRDN